MAEAKVYKLEDLKKNNTEKSCWLAVNGKVYDVTTFLEEHPGGYDIILSSTGKDATQDFEEVGHSNSAKKLLEKYLIGTYEGGAPSVSKKENDSVKAAAEVKPMSTASRAFSVVLPVALLAVAVGLNYYLSTKRQ